MKKTLIAVLALVVLGGFLYLVALNGRYEVNANRLVKIDKWTGEVWIYNPSTKQWVTSPKKFDTDNYFKEHGILLKEKKSQVPEFDPSQPYTVVKDEKSWEPQEYKDAVAAEIAFFDPKRPYEKKSFSQGDLKKLYDMDYWVLIENDPEFQKISAAEKEKVRSEWAKEFAAMLSRYPNDYILMNIKKAQAPLLKATPENTKLINDENERIKQFVKLTGN